MKAPHIPAPLLEWLEGLFPDRCPTLGMSDREVWIAVGAQEVLRKLRHTYDSQIKDSLS